MKIFNLSSDLDIAKLPSDNLKRVAEVRKMYGEEILPQFGIENERLSAVVKKNNRDMYTVEFVVDNLHNFHGFTPAFQHYFDDSLYEAKHHIDHVVSTAFGTDGQSLYGLIVPAMDVPMNTELTMLFDPIDESITIRVDGKTEHIGRYVANIAAFKNRLRQAIKNKGLAVRSTRLYSEGVGGILVLQLAEIDISGKVSAVQQRTITVNTCEHISLQNFFNPNSTTLELTSLGEEVPRQTMQEILDVMNPIQHKKMPSYSGTFDDRGMTWEGVYNNPNNNVNYRNNHQYVVHNIGNNRAHVDINYNVNRPVPNVVWTDLNEAIRNLQTTADGTIDHVPRRGN